MHTQDKRDPQQRGNARVRVAGLNVLKRLAAHPGGEEHILLGAVLPDPLDANAVTDTPSAFGQPGIVIREVGHPSDIQALMIISQPGMPGIP